MIRHLLMPVDDATRRQFLVTGSVLAALGAAACGDEGADNPIDELTASPLWKPETVVTVPSPQTYLGPYSYAALLDSLVEALS